jgi:hypothetical protein
MNHYFLYRREVLSNIWAILNNLPDGSGYDVEWDLMIYDEDLTLQKTVVHSKLIEGMFKHEI